MVSDNILRLRAAQGFRAINLSTTQTLVAMLATAQHPNGYYPTCADLIEVTAHIATPATGRTDITDPWAAENLCGPFQIRFYLDPKPKVEFTSEPTKNIVNQKYTATANLQVKMV